LARTCGINPFVIYSVRWLAYFHGFNCVLFVQVFCDHTLMLHTLSSTILNKSRTHHSDRKHVRVFPLS